MAGSRRVLWCLTFSLWLILCSYCSSQPRCLGAFDIYFILDKSSSVPTYNFQRETVNFVENITNSFVSPSISFITFSDPGKPDVIMELTKDRKKIAKGLSDLRQVKPNGLTYLAGAIGKANEQIIRLGQKTASVILIVTDGRLYDQKESIQQGDKARSLGASVIAVGVSSYVKSQLEELASKPSEQYVFTSKRFDSLKGLIHTIVEKSCIEILSVSPTKFCTGVPYSVVLTGDGFTKTDNISKVICSFRFNQTYRKVQRPTLVEATRLECPGFVVNETGKKIILQVSVNNGLTFVSSNVAISSKECVNVTEAPPTNSTLNPAARIPGSRSNVGLAVFFVVLFLFLALILLWWFKPLICKKAPPKYRPAPPRPPPPAPLPKGKLPSGKWATVDASYYGGGGVGGIAPVRVDWGDKGSTEAGSKLAKAKGAKTKDAEDTEKLTGARGGSGGAGSPPGCMAVARAKMAGCMAALSRGHQRLASLRPRPGGHPLYSSPDAHA